MAKIAVDTALTLSGSWKMLRLSCRKSLEPGWNQ